MALPHARTNLPRAFRAVYPAEQWFECEATASFGDDTDFGRVDVVIDVTDPGAVDFVDVGRTETGTVDVDAELLGRVIERIFSAGLLLKSPTNGTALSAGIQGAIAELDEAIADITSDVFQQTVRSRSAPPAKAT